MYTEGRMSGLMLGCAQVESVGPRSKHLAGAPTCQTRLYPLWQGWIPTQLAVLSPGTRALVTELTPQGRLGVWRMGEAGLQVRECLDISESFPQQLSQHAFLFPRQGSDLSTSMRSGARGPRSPSLSASSTLNPRAVTTKRMRACAATSPTWASRKR